MFVKQIWIDKNTVATIIVMTNIEKVHDIKLLLYQNKFLWRIADDMDVLITFLFKHNFD